MRSRFSNTQNKDLVRQVDYKRIKGCFNNKKIIYFGLPGKDAVDVITWKDLIEYVHAAELFYNDATDLHETLVKNGFSKNLKIFQEDICELIKNPIYSKDLNKYHLINFDFTGVMISKSETKESTDEKINIKRLEAISDMIKIQIKKFDILEKCLFLTTFYATRNSSPELDKAIEELIEILPSFQKLTNSNIGEICNYLKQEKTIQGAKIAAIFPVWFFQNSEGFDPICKDIIYYIGSGNSPMIHFVFELTRKERFYSTIINITKIESIPLQKIKEIKNGKILETNLGIPELKRKI